MMPLSFPDSTGLIVFALNLLLVVTVVCLMALTTVRLFFRHHPTVRYYLCLIALIAILLSPFFVSLQGFLGYSLVTLALPESIAPPASAPVVPVASGFPVEMHTPALAEDPPRLTTWLSQGGGAVLLVWLLGIVWGTVRLIRGWRTVSRLTTGIIPWNAADDSVSRDQLEKALRSSLPPIYTSPSIESPVAVGLLRPMILLPEGWTEALSAVQLRQVLLHECAHVAFRHMVGGLVERIARLLFWFHPLVPALCRELGRAREEVCDNVASQEEGAVCYARTLLALAQGTIPAPHLASVLALLGPETSLEQRISGLLHPRRNRMIPGKQGTRWALLYATGLVLSLTVLVRVASSNQKNLQDSYTTLGPDAFFVRQQEVAREGTAARASSDEMRLVFTTRDIPPRSPDANGMSASKEIHIALAHHEQGEAKAGSPVAEQPIEIRAVQGTPVPVEQEEPKPEPIEVSFAVASPVATVAPNVDASPAVEELNAVLQETPQEPKAGETKKTTAEQNAELQKRLAEKDAIFKAREAEFKKREAALKASLVERTALLKQREAELAKMGADRLKQRDAELRARGGQRRLIEKERLETLKTREIQLRKLQADRDAAEAKAREAEARYKETKNP